jgi:hypothetical protein
VNLCMYAKHWIASVILLSFGAPAWAAGDPADELKSAIVLSFLRYSAWKDPVSAEFVQVGVLGRPALANILRRLVEGKTVNNRAIRVIDVKSAAEPCRCQIIYIATDRRAELQQVLQTAHSNRILTIGEADRFLELGGAVNLLEIDGHMSFEFNLETLEENGIDISSKLLRLGQMKKRRGP